MKGRAPDRTRLKLSVRGAVQGVGFRPFVFRLATELGLNGWVNNSAQGVFIEVEGARSGLERFLLRIEAEKPPRSSIQSLETSWLDPVGYTAFEIRESESSGVKTALVLPDIATCPECLAEVLDPKNRRYFYPFTNCTNCGPRFSIIQSLPYDRANTSMKKFQMCPQCQAEYEDPHDRRFHAQPNACPECGPQLELWRSCARERAANSKAAKDQPRSAGRSHEALQAAAAAIRRGEIVAIKGLGGFHLMVDARQHEAVRRLRDRKHREEKPFALMFPSVEGVRSVCEVSPLEERLLRSPEAPIVLLKHRSPLTSPLSPYVAPGNPNLGVLLPYTPLHHLLMSILGFPVVATSGNLSDEPICIDEREAFDRLGGIADLFLVHNRPIVRHVDDSIVCVMMDRELVLRRARGYAPLPITLHAPRSTLHAQPLLAVGAHLKNTVALAVGPQVFISQHIGDLETDQAFEAFRRVIEDFEKLYETEPTLIAADLHPDYLSTRFARELSTPTAIHETGQTGMQPFVAGATKVGTAENPRFIGVQHHIAHVLSCMAENELEPPVLGVSWDGTGYGTDGTVWGGEFFTVTDTACQRVAHLRTFPLPGGDKAVREPRRAALGLLYELFGDAAFEMKFLPPLQGFGKTELATLRNMLERRLNSPRTSSIGRLFDVVAALAGLRQETRFEGQSAMELEFALEGMETEEAYPLPIVDGQPTIQSAESVMVQLGPTVGGASVLASRKPKESPDPRLAGSLAPPNSTTAVTSPAPQILDWAPMIEAVLADTKRGVPISAISARFHNALAESIVAVARRVGQERVALSGGCFQNRYLTERAVWGLRTAGFRAYWHQRVPPNDGGIALGQIIAAAREVK
jgi:hydrogenase maturation protein HypF